MLLYVHIQIQMRLCEEKDISCLLSDTTRSRGNRDTRRRNGYRGPDEKSSLLSSPSRPLSVSHSSHLSIYQRKREKRERKESVSPGVPARKLRPIRIRQALFKVTSCHFFSPVAAIGSVDRCIRFSNPPVLPPRPQTGPLSPSSRSRAAGSSGAPRRCARARVHVYTHTRARGWADEWQVVPGIPTAVPRSVGSLLSYSKCWRVREKRREEERP